MNRTAAIVSNCLTEWRVGIEGWGDGSCCHWNYIEFQLKKERLHSFTASRYCHCRCNPSYNATIVWNAANEMKFSYIYTYYLYSLLILKTPNMGDPPKSFSISKAFHNTKCNKVLFVQFPTCNPLAVAATSTKSTEPIERPYSQPASQPARHPSRQNRNLIYRHQLWK